MGTLRNIGNSCYMNAVLYALRFTPKFLTNLHHLIANIQLLQEEIEVTASHTCTKCTASNNIRWDETMTESITMPYPELIDVIVALHKVFMNLTSAVDRLGGKRQTNSLQKLIFKVSETFKPKTQQDSHEYLMFILNAVRDISSTLTDLVSSHSGMFESIKNPASKLCFAYFQKNFIGHRLTTTRCFSCETVHSHVEEMIDVFVAVPTCSKLDGNFIRDSCVTTEKLRDKIKCSECIHFCESTVTVAYPELPRILIVQIGRFESETKKLNTVTPIPYQLDCFCFECDALAEDAKNVDHQYRLYGIIVHLGKTPTSGHYMAYIRSIAKNVGHESGCEFDDCCKLNLWQWTTDETEDAAESIHNWYICNDDQIIEMTQSDFESKVKDEATQKTPYILFYARNDICCMNLDVNHQ